MSRVKKYILSILAAILIALSGCKTVYVPVPYMPNIPEVLLQEPDHLQTIKQGSPRAETK